MFKCSYPEQSWLSVWNVMYVWHQHSRRPMCRTALHAFSASPIPLRQWLPSEARCAFDRCLELRPAREKVVLRRTVQHEPRAFPGPEHTTRLANLLATFNALTSSVGGPHFSFLPAFLGSALGLVGSTNGRPNRVARAFRFSNSSSSVDLGALLASTADAGAVGGTPEDCSVFQLCRGRTLLMNTYSLRDERCRLDRRCGHRRERGR